MTDKPIIHIAIFASGAGSNAKNIITSSPVLLLEEKGDLKNDAKDTILPTLKEDASVVGFKTALIVCNNPQVGVLKIAADNHIPALLIEKNKFCKDGYLPELKARQIDFIVLAGFLWKIPDALIQAYPQKIINIHPALLPSYGGKGMYGHKVHEAVIAALEKKSGITIHYVDEHYDNGDIIFQASCRVKEQDTPGSLAQKIHTLEHLYYPHVIQWIINHQFLNKW